MKKILSIDGGGIRGIIPGQILVALEEKLQKRSGRPDARIAEYFDFFAGTSTGGILCCILMCPSADDPNKPRFSAKQAVDLYIKNGGEIFDRTVWQKVKALGGNLDEKFDAAAIERILKEYFGDLKLSQLVKPCIITAYDVENRNAHFFAQQDNVLKGDGGDFLVRDVCRATSAAPTYFEAASVKSVSGVTYALVDGGVFANNPSLCAYSEVRNAKGEPTAKDMLIVSLGTGSENRSYPYDDVKDFGAIGWVRPVIDIMMAGAAETTDYHLKKMFGAQHHDKNYIRIQPTNMRRASYELDNASKENIEALVEVGIDTAQNCPELDEIVELLIADLGQDPVEFE
ncbi:patatin-like phospholipase family protein [Mucilaginibacter myungsuensis]|uniref:Patatin-like phospholipase family protein n=1 Tax=Mucilaginibacter myungsuensis TaxID=649104 RepID=A0A929PWP5_9SPHI|nr:patatin-like phospholipase family protein [Mucilaginibacter myungsuensis]MBE9661565.1 patatin-like phospholipase family protein [Mucilaginibacter myungsuensis]MDN3597708.1 patatin-like phospholipase family protein [Mucilaginibacter myungsuensis]